MKKTKQVWTTVSPNVHLALKKIAESNEVAISKIVLHIVFHEMPIKLQNDYLFSTKTAHRIGAFVSEDEFIRIHEMAKMNKVSPSKLLRMATYTYLKEKNII